MTSATLGVTPVGAGANDTSPTIANGLTIDDAITLEGIINAPDYNPTVEGDLLRQYRAFFGRKPDVGGAQYWIGLNKGGLPLDEIAEFFTQSQEFANNYAGTTNRVYLERVYQNVLGRDYDQEGFDYWLGLVESGELTRGGVVRWITANAEFIARFPYLPADKGDHSIEDALPLVGGTFFHEERFNDTVWIGELAGLVEMPVSEFNSEQGRCLALVGIMSPLQLDAGTHLNNSFDTPDLGLLVEGERVRPGGGSCDRSGIESAGYDWRLDTSVTIGTDSPFFETFFLPTTGPQRVDNVFVGDPNRTDATFFKADTTTSPPTLPQRNVGPNNFLEQALPLDGQPIIHEDRFDDVEWKVELGAIVSSQNSERGDPGRCVHIVGTVTPTRIDEGVVTTGFDTPNFGLIVEGRYIETGAGECDSSAVEQAGYGWILRAEVTVGTGYPFHDVFLIPEDMIGDIQALVVGRSYATNAVFYQGSQPQSDIPTP